MKKQLIINADDFGIHLAVNEAVRKAATEGILTSTSLMAGGDAFDEAVEMARSMPSLGIGIHLTLVGGIKPVLPPSEVPSLTWDNGVFCHDYGKLIVRDLEGKISLSEVYAEWDAQIQKIMNTGLPVTHMDGHQHMHMWPHFYPIARDLAKKYHISCMRVPDEDVLYGMKDGHIIRWAAKNGLSLLSRMHRPDLKKNHIRTNDHFFGMLYGGHLSPERFAKFILQTKPGITEIMCHPSADTRAMEDTFHWGYHGEDELAGLLADINRELIEKKQISLISYRDVREE
ncbi:hopanoid biosynthesis associated protein HpnK [Dialister histaminiformans]|uniref:Hopanoid biosynthesis associated protein HpnK n=1 Tax=Allisonella histaminiformans TaxID=209880 RepID=A0A1G5V8V9_9FIRM|nr:ChbG/HpnK family deacetylase [Allisonella histaminiformans]SDA42279.1 hopanoid biosynthesis associated protein HpnK [Allisonella histaminiformans]